MTRRRRAPGWRLAVRLSVTAALGGVALAAVGAFTAAWIAFAFGALCALVGAGLSRR